ncbi:MAG TPA: hypothetical protein VF174_14040 [Micromonosporaceae bacterium]
MGRAYDVAPRAVGPGVGRDRPPLWADSLRERAPLDRAISLVKQIARKV